MYSFFGFSFKMSEKYANDSNKYLINFLLVLILMNLKHLKCLILSVLVFVCGVCHCVLLAPNKIKIIFFPTFENVFCRDAFISLLYNSITIHLVCYFVQGAKSLYRLHLLSQLLLENFPLEKKYTGYICTKRKSIISQRKTKFSIARCVALSRVICQF